MKHGWVIIFGSSACTYNESGADIKRRHDIAQLIIVNVIIAEDFWKFCAMQRMKVNSENYDIILGISTYYTESYNIYVFMTSYMTSYLYVSGEYYRKKGCFRVSI